MPVVQSQGMFWSLALNDIDNFREANVKYLPVFGRLYYTTERIMQSTEGRKLWLDQHLEQSLKL